MLKIFSGCFYGSWVKYVKMGIIASLFILKLILIINQCELITIIIAPEMMVTRMVVKIRGIISMERI